MKKDHYENLIERLNFFVEYLRKYEKGQDEDLLKTMKKINEIAYFVDGKILADTNDLKDKLNEFLLGETVKEEVLEKAVKLRNDLWEL